MGKLTGYTEPTITVPVKSGEGDFSLACRGLNLDEVLALVRDYTEFLSPAYDAARAGNLNGDALFDFLIKMIEEVPVLANTIIYFGIDGEEDDLETITKMPIGVKIELIEAIVRMTFHSENSGGKAMEIVMSAIRRIQEVLRPQP
jgi:hypothetical protein